MKKCACERSTRFAPWNAVLIYAAFAVVLTWPLALHFNRAVIGDLKSDVWKHVWGFWWMRRSLFTDHVLPLYTWHLNYPYGGSLFFIDPLGGMLSIPLQLLMSPVAAYNAMVLFNIVLACSGAFLLARHLTRSAPAALVAGVIYGCSPYLMSNITSGISESFNVGWIPFFALYYTRALRGMSRADACRAGAFLGLATIGCWYYGVFCVVYAFFFFVAELIRLAWRRRAAASREASAAGDAAPTGCSLFFRVFGQAVLVALVSGAIILPVAYCFRYTLNSDVSLVFRVRNKQNVDFYLSETFHNISRLVDYVSPGKDKAIRTYTVDRLTRVSYVGWIVLVLSLWAALRVRRRDLRWWCGVAVMAVTFSLGPFLYITSDIHLTGRFPLYMWMYDWFPFFSQVSIPFRFNTVAMLALAMLSAYALADALRPRPRGERGLLALAVSLAVLIEVMYVSPAPFPMPLSSTDAPPVLARLATESGPCGLLDVPVQRCEGELLPGEYFYYQMVHGKFIPNRVEGEIPLFVYHNRFMLQLFHLEHDWTGYPNDSERALWKSLDELRAFRFRYIVVHENLLRPGAGPRVHRMLTWFLGPPRHRDGEITVYDVEAAPSRGVAGAGIP